MNRRALIVVTPQCPGQKPLPGAQLDAETWETFLLSPEGGAWKKEEIHVSVNPQAKVLKVLLAMYTLEKLDFGLIAFSGHGECVQINNERETRIYLSQDEYISENNFKLSASRELVILDACRERRVESALLEDRAKKIASINENFAMATDRVQRLADSRKVYEKNISENPLGRSLVYSCAVNETAADKPSFTQILIQEAEKSAMDSAIVEVKSIAEVFPLAERIVSGAGFKQPQHPEYNAGRRTKHLPFAVSI